MFPGVSVYGRGVGVTAVSLGWVPAMRGEFWIWEGFGSGLGRALVRTRSLEQGLPRVALTGIAPIQSRPVPGAVRGGRKPVRLWELTALAPAPELTGAHMPVILCLHSLHVWFVNCFVNVIKWERLCCFKTLPRFLDYSYHLRYLNLTLRSFIL